MISAFSLKSKLSIFLPEYTSQTVFSGEIFLRSIYTTHARYACVMFILRLSFSKSLKALHLIVMSARTPPPTPMLLVCGVVLGAVCDSKKGGGNTTVDQKEHFGFARRFEERECRVCVCVCVSVCVFVYSVCGVVGRELLMSWRV